MDARQLLRKSLIVLVLLLTLVVCVAYSNVNSQVARHCRQTTESDQGAFTKLLDGMATIAYAQCH